MSLKSAIVSRVAERLTGEERLKKKRAEAERARKAKGDPHTVHYFHQADDPYSHLVVQVLGDLARRYAIELKPHLVPPPPDWAAPDRQRLIDWSRRDAEALARKAGLSFIDPGSQPDDHQVEAAYRRFAAALDDDTFVEKAPAISAALWSPGEPVPDPYFATEARALELIEEGGKLREDLGHYLGGTLYYGGEWYWGIDRLEHLEDRLAELGARAADAPADAIYPQPVDTHDGKPVKNAPAIDYFCSFRSPYTYLAAKRVFELGRHYGAPVNIRFVLPMVMRGLVVPKGKRRYITFDAAREARRTDVPFGKVADPVGEPVERAYSILPWAIEQGAGEAFLISFLSGVWSEGIDAGSDAGLQKLVTRAGLDWETAKGFIGKDHWRPIEEANQKEMLSLGLWGVPSFRVGEVSAWGNDRLWVIEDELRRLGGKGLLGKIGF